MVTSTSREDDVIKRAVCLGFLASIGLSIVCSSSVASAAECGTQESGKEPVLGTLELKPELSDTEFKGDDKRLLLLFEVSGCSLSSSSEVEVEVRSSELEPEVFGQASVKSKRSLLVVEIPVDQGAFDAGKHNAAITVSGEAVTPTTQKATVQKTEGLLWPTLIVFLCWLGGCGASIAVARNEVQRPVKTKVLQLAIALFLAAVAAGAVWKTGYFDVEVWRLEAKTVLPLLLGAAPAAAGAAAGSLKAKPAFEHEG
jgi:hypothetical protein